MNWSFTELTINYPYLSAAFKFMILGTLGEWLGVMIKTRGQIKTFAPLVLVQKMFIWSLLGIIIRWVFTSFTLFIPLQAAAGLLPIVCSEPHNIWRALAISVELNIFFSPFLMYFHRFLDNLCERKWNWQGMHVAIYAIAWFWLPAHTVTFLLPDQYRVIFAAVLGVALGIILGYASRNKTIESSFA